MQIYIRYFQTTEIAINPQNTKGFLKKENYRVQIIEIMFTFKPPTFLSNGVQLLKYEILKLFVWESLHGCHPSPSPALFNSYQVCWQIQWQSFLSFPGETLLFFKPGRGIHSGRFQLDVELFQGLLQLLLVPSEVGSDGVVEEDQLVV